MFAVWFNKPSASGDSENDSAVILNITLQISGRFDCITSILDKWPDHLWGNERCNFKPSNFEQTNNLLKNVYNCSAKSIICVL